MPATLVPAISSSHMEPAIESPNRNILESGTSVELPFTILNETTKFFPKFNATRRSLLIKFKLQVKNRNLWLISGNALLL